MRGIIRSEQHLRCVGDCGSKAPAPAGMFHIIKSRLIGSTYMSPPVRALDITGGLIPTQREQSNQ